MGADACGIWGGMPIVGAVLVAAALLYLPLPPMGECGEGAAAIGGPEG